MMNFIGLLIALLFNNSVAFQTHPHHSLKASSSSKRIGPRRNNNIIRSRRRRNINISSSPLLLSAKRQNDDDNNNNNNNNNNNIDANWLLELQQRQQSIDEKVDTLRECWIEGEDFQQALVGIPDWIRRVSMYEWPIAACGSSKGDVYAIQCETGQVLGCGTRGIDQRRYVDCNNYKDDDTEKIMKDLYGDYDGGGTLAVGINWNNVIAHAGRNPGGVDIWGNVDLTKKKDQYVTESKFIDDYDDEDREELKNNAKLTHYGTLLEGILVTAIDWIEDTLWVGTEDGRVLVYTIHIDDEIEEFNPDLEIEWKDLGGTILSLRCNEDLDMAVATTSTGSVELLPYNKPECIQSFHPPFVKEDAVPSSALIVQVDEYDDDDERKYKKQKEEGQTFDTTTNTKHYTIVCGGTDGSLCVQPLNNNKNNDEDDLDWTSPFKCEVISYLIPYHGERVTALASPCPRLLLSGSQDGTIRIWDLSANYDDKYKYLLGGYKPWMGSFNIVLNGKRLITDGQDNAISITTYG